MAEPKSGVRSNTPAWQDHENHVASLYRGMGYVVTQNINIDGQQVDIICEKWMAGIGRTKLYIDCKHTHLEENRSVSKDDVDNFIYSFKSRADRNHWTAGILVSNRPFSQFAKATAKDQHNIYLKTIGDLHEEILHVHSYLHESIRKYDDTNHFSISSSLMPPCPLI